MSYEDSYAKAFPFCKMVDDAIQIITEGIKLPALKGGFPARWLFNIVPLDPGLKAGLAGHGPVKRRNKMILIVHNRSRENGPVIAQEITKRLRELIF